MKDEKYIVLYKPLYLIMCILIFFMNNPLDEFHKLAF